MLKEKISGKAWCYGDNVNTDLIYPGRFLSTYEPAQMGQYAMAGIDPTFSRKIQAGDILVVGNNFGCGSSREQAAICLKYAGISAIVAKSFARIFYRNIINQGIPGFVSPNAVDIINNGDTLVLEPRRGLIQNLTTGEESRFELLPGFLQDIIHDGGIIKHLRKKFE